jgi:hypothetical protein
MTLVRPVGQGKGPPSASIHCNLFADLFAWVAK